MAKEQNVPISEVAESGSNYTFQNFKVELRHHLINILISIVWLAILKHRLLEILKSNTMGFRSR